MDRAELETRLLDKLTNGELDGIVGEDDYRETEGRVYRRMIVNGTPCLFNSPMGECPTKENVVVESRFKTDEMKLWFLRTYGWKMEDPDVKHYSRPEDGTTAYNRRDEMILFADTVKRVAMKWIRFLKRCR